jgi:hypothetical protein
LFQEGVELLLDSSFDDGGGLKHCNEALHRHCERDAAVADECE